MSVRCYGWKNYVNSICCSNKKGFRNKVDANNEAKATYDLLICIMGISGNEILIKLCKACISTKCSIVKIRQNEHQPNYMDSSRHCFAAATIALISVPQKAPFLELLNPGYCSRCRISDLMLQLSWMISSLAHHICSTENLNNIYKLHKSCLRESADSNNA